MRLPRQRICPILPGVRSFLNYRYPSLAMRDIGGGEVLVYLGGDVLHTPAVSLAGSRCGLKLAHDCAVGDE